ncbi:hypothetical protein L1049_018147 [Liquidambar formosana]|uniref:Pentatricopeptide repeat-containing protein n=1 Tax=Liquidambar formosana TaxID=63359 RepID=A0AAP0NIQ7_LIQFO
MINPTSKWIKPISVDLLKQHCTSITNTKQAHALLLRTHLLHHNLFVSKLLSFLAISESGNNLNYARKIFTQIHNPDPFIFNTMIRGYAKSHNPSEAMSFFYFMIGSDISPDNYTYTFVFTACARLRALEMGRTIHCQVLKSGFESDSYVVNSLIQFYGDCGCFNYACRVFDESPVRDVVTWNVMINAHIHRGLYGQAFDFFEEMVRSDNILPDDVTMISLVSACAKVGDLERGKSLHFHSEGVNLDKNLSVGNAILDMYCKCGDLESALEVFNRMPERDVLSWTSMLSGLANSGHFQESLVLFRKMQFEKIQPDEVTLVSVLSACAQTGALDQGKYIHLLMDRNGIHRDVVLETALVDMYAKCGAIGFGQRSFW